MIADRLLDRLDAVRRTGDGRWIARCPAHEDRSPSLSIRETDERLLIHCFAGCAVAAVVAAVGLEVSDLFPPRPDPLKHTRSLRRPFPAADILRCVNGELNFLMICVGDVAEGQELESADIERLRRAFAVIREGILAGGLA